MTSHKGPGCEADPGKGLSAWASAQPEPGGKAQPADGQQQPGQRMLARNLDQLDDVVRFLILRRCVGLFGLGLQFF